jgi:CheY-like chemotaxis protein
VTDNGIGIPEEIRLRIFEPFFTTKERDSGHGLGLSQVLGIVSQHDGFVDVSSTPHKGSTFTIYLPALPPSDLNQQPGIRQTFPMGNGETVLVVEDDEFVRSALVASLESLNYATLEAENGRAALLLFAERGPEVDVVLSDLVMPELGGTHLLREFRVTAPSVKLLAMTGHPPALHALAHNEVDGWLNKPINLERLAHALHEALNKP